MRPKAIAMTRLVYATLFLAVGCASKVFQHPLLATSPSDPSAEVYFFREDVFAGSAFATPVHVNGEILLQLRRATYAKVFLKPGSHQVVGFSNSQRTCGGPMDFEAGKTYFVLFRFFMNSVTGEMCSSPGLITEDGARSLMTTYSAILQ